MTEDEVLNSVPGPSPWYLQNRGLQVAGAIFRWEPAGQKFPGRTLLRAPDGQVLLVLGFQCYVLPVGQHVLIWHADPPEETNAHDNRVIMLVLLDLSHLRPLHVDQALQQVSPIAVNPAWSAFANVSLALSEGTHAWSVPSEFRELPELLMLGHSYLGASGQPQPSSQMNLCLYVASPANQSVSVVPQRWFNHGNYDFGYQWPSRVARHPETQEIIGEGVRIGRFVLDPSGKERIR